MPPRGGDRARRAIVGLDRVTANPGVPTTRSTGAATRSPDPSRTSGRAPAYVLLGDPGSGKSTSFAAECAALGSAACLFTARDFRAFDPAAHPEWRGKTLFIDGLDEVRAGSRDLQAILDAIRRCRRFARMAALPFVVPRGGLARRERSDQSRQGVSARQSDRAAAGPARRPGHRTDSERPRRSRTPLRSWPRPMRKGSADSCENPQCLRMLADVVTDGGGWPGSRLELFEQACLRMAREHNGEHEAAGSGGSGAAARGEELLDAAGRLCAVFLLSGAADCAIAESREDADYPHLSRCGDEYAERCRQVSGTKLFRAVDEGRFRPVHRHVAEFLAGRHLAGLVEGGRRNGRTSGAAFPARRVLTLMTGHDGRVVTALRALSAWVAAQSGAARRELVERDPIGVAVYGDASRFSTPEKVALLRAFAAGERPTREAADGVAARERPVDLGPRRTRGAGHRAGAAGHSHRSAPRRRASDAGRRPPPHLLPQGAALPGLAPLLFDLVRDETRSGSVRRFALDALIHRSRRDGRPRLTASRGCCRMFMPGRSRIRTINSSAPCSSGSIPGACLRPRCGRIFPNRPHRSSAGTSLSGDRTWWRQLRMRSSPTTSTCWSPGATISGRRCGAAGSMSCPPNCWPAVWTRTASAWRRGVCTIGSVSV